MADRIRAASVTGAGATDESRADGAAEATGLEPALSGMGDTGMSERGLAEPEKLSAERAADASAWRCEIRRRKVGSARTGDTGVAGWWSEVVKPEEEVEVVLGTEVARKTAGNT